MGIISPLQVVPFRDQDAAAWDVGVQRAPMATFLHTRKFLSYHGDRFRDISVCLRGDEGALGWFPAAVDPEDAKRVVSHPGLTYGGVFHDGRLRGEEMFKAMEGLLEYYRGKGFASMRYKAVPLIYHQSPSADDEHALFRLGASRYRCDLSCAVDLFRGPALSERRRRGVKKAKSKGIQLNSGVRWTEGLWEVLKANLAEKHGVRPVHTLEEILELHRRFPEEIRFQTASLEDRVVAGAVLFVTPRVTHAQYIASSEEGREAGALDALFESALEEARSRGARYFNFGISTEDEGRVLNDGLYQFKSEFGGGGVLHECYEIQL